MVFEVGKEREETRMCIVKENSYFIIALMLYLTEFSTASKRLNLNNPTHGTLVATEGEQPRFPQCEVVQHPPIQHLGVKKSQWLFDNEI